VKGSGVELRAGPGEQHERLLNERASKAFGTRMYLELDSSAQVRRTCEAGAWSYVQAQNYLTETHRGWVQTRHLVSAEMPRTVDELDLEPQDEPHRSDLTRMVRRIESENSRCSRVSLVTRSASKGSASNPVWFATCEAKGGPSFNVFFSRSDMQNPAKRMTAILNPSPDKALSACRSEAMRLVRIPSSVDFPKSPDGLHDYPNGRTRIWSQFKTKSDVGGLRRYDITCLVMPDGRADERSTALRLVE
jgi:hypothetical protein